MTTNKIPVSQDHLAMLSKLCGWDHICGAKCCVCEEREARLARDIELNTFDSLTLDEV